MKLYKIAKNAYILETSEALQLFSYDEIVAEYKQNQLSTYATKSRTSNQHVKQFEEFIKQNKN